MTSRQRVMTVLDGGVPDRVPFFDWVDAGFRDKLAAHLGRDTLDNLECVRVLGMDALYYERPYSMTPISDETSADDTGRVHYLGHGLIKTPEDLAEMVFPDPATPGYFDDAKRFVDSHGDEDLALYAGLRPGIQPTILSLGWKGFSRSVVKKTGMVERLFARYVEWCQANLEGLQELGFDFLVLYDDMAFKSGMMFAPDVYREVFLPGYRELVDAIKIPWGYHSDGDLNPVLDDLLSLGMNMLNPVEPPCMDIDEVKRVHGHRVALWGNIDMVHTLYDSPLEVVDAEVKQRIEEIGVGGGYVCASANSIADYLSVENVLCMAEAVKKYGKYPLNGS
ncbi:MAG: hypothetical protein GY925_14415 [Actinomycetia bacterium]|nr:hypothetical protein [Actinomycetes bacterium]